LSADKIKGISFVYLDKTDVVHHKLVGDIINAYELSMNNSEPCSSLYSRKFLLS